MTNAGGIDTSAESQTEATPSPVGGLLNGQATSNYTKHTSGNPIQRRLIDRFHHTIRECVIELVPATFLDAGCGEGFVAEVLLERLPALSITGFDFNPESVDIARERVRRATFQTASIFEIPHADNSFDVVGCFEVLEHQHDPASALAELARVAKDAVVLSVPHEPYFSLANALRGKNWDIRPRGSDPDHKQIWTRAAFAEFVRREPLLDVTTISGSFPWTIVVARKRPVARADHPTGADVAHAGS